MTAREGHRIPRKPFTLPQRGRPDASDRETMILPPVSPLDPGDTRPVPRPGTADTNPATPVVSPQPKR